jgi:hypothetical protein
MDKPCRLTAWASASESERSIFASRNISLYLFRGALVMAELT